MAFIHTNNLTGNDTTGTGSTGAPYKTIGKALSVALSGDFIKVAGGQWTVLTGDFTFTNSGITVQTSTSQVGIVAVNDILTFEDGQYGFDKHHHRVIAVSATTITLANAWAGPTQVTSALFRLNAYHYSTATNTVNLEPNWNPTLTRPNGRTGITISGGWSSDFTTQNGWTVGRSTNATPANVNFFNIVSSPTGTGNLGDWRENLIVDRIMMCRISNLFIPNLTLANLPSFQSSFALKEIAIINNRSGGGIVTGTSGTFSVYNVDSSTPANVYLTPDATVAMIDASMNRINPSTSPSSSLKTDYNLWLNIGAAATGGQSAQMQSIVGQNLGLQGSANKITLHLRASYISASPAFIDVPCTFTPLNSATSSFYFQKVNVYCNKPQLVSFPAGYGTTVQIEDIEYLGPFGGSGKNGIMLGNSGQILVDLSQEGKLIEDFKPCAGYSYGGTGGANYNTNLSTLAQINLSSIQVKDAEGLKTLDPYGTIYFKDQVNNWLRVSSNFWFDNINPNGPLFIQNWKLVGVNDKPQAPFTVTFRLKDDGNGGSWDKIGIQYGPTQVQIVTQSISLTTSFADYYITVDPTTIPDWNSFNFPLYCGIQCTSSNLNSTSNSFTHCFVESVTIS